MEFDARMEWGRNALEEGVCDALVEGEADARTEALQHCSVMEFHSEMNFAQSPSYFVFRDDSAEIANRISNATLLLRGSPEYQNLEVTWLKKGRSCASEVGLFVRSGVAVRTFLVSPGFL